MRNSLAAFLGWRYARATTQNRFIRFISASSVVGIALGCMVLIVVLSAMNGFERELKERLLSIVSHIEYRAVDIDGIQNWPDIARTIQAYEQVEAVAPFIKLNGLIQKGTQLKPLELRGIDWQYENKVSDIVNYLPKETLAKFENQQGLILGQGLASELDLKVGDSVEILLPKISTDFKLQAPNLIRLPLVGVFSIGGSLDYGLGYIPLPLASIESGWVDGVQGLRVKVSDVFKAPQLSREIGAQLPVYVYIDNWTHQHGHLYNDIQLVRQVMYIILFLVIAVACFNIVSTLVMAVNERAGDIAILKTMGATNGTIIKTFMIQGVHNGLLGVVLGLTLGVFFSCFLTDILRVVEHVFGVHFLAADVYFVDFLPSELHWRDVALTGAIALILSVLSTVYPAVRATRINPAHALGN